MDEFLIARFVHIFFAVIWLAHIYASKQKAFWYVQEFKNNPQNAKQYLTKSALIGGISSIAAFAAGWWLVEQTSGWADAPMFIHIGATLGFVALLIGAVPTSIAWRKLANLCESNANENDIEKMVSRINFFNLATQILWIATLALMIFRHAF